MTGIGTAIYAIAVICSPLTGMCSEIEARMVDGMTIEECEAEMPDEARAFARSRQQILARFRCEERQNRTDVPT